MSRVDQVGAFRGWLETAEGYDYLLRFTSRLAQHGCKVQGSPGLGWHDWDGRTDADRQEALGDLCHDLLLFLYDSFLPDAQRNPDVVNLAATNQFRRLLELAWGRFIWRRQDHMRSKQVNPRGYLYRRLRELLTLDPRFVVTADAQGGRWYCLAAAATETQQAALSTQGMVLQYTDWPPPPPDPGKQPERYLFSSQWLTKTAVFFWLTAAQRLGSPLRMPIRELSRYLASHHPWLNNPAHLDGGDDLIERIADAGDSPEEQCLYGEGLDCLAAISPLAAQLVATWTVEQRQVFVRRLADPPQSFREISQELGLADHNRAYALYQHAVTSLRRFTASWPGPPLADLPREVAEVFVEEMKTLCKEYRT